jgi:hypothetical protein
MKTRYFLYYNRPVKAEFEEDGSFKVTALHKQTGLWEGAGREIWPDLSLNRHADVREIDSEAEFIQEVERWRARFAAGQGPAFALYALMNQIEESARKERRRLTEEEKNFLEELRVRSFREFERANPLSTVPSAQA